MNVDVIFIDFLTQSMIMNVHMTKFDDEREASESSNNLSIVAFNR